MLSLKKKRVDNKMLTESQANLSLLVLGLSNGIKPTCNSHACIKVTMNIRATLKGHA